jgi:hypothetical protein
VQVDLPFTVEYLTPGVVPLGEVIDSLIALQSLIEEGGSNLPLFVSGLQIEAIRVNVRSIIQESPLREVFLVSLFLAFQKDLEAEIPAMVEHITGQPIPEGFETLVTLSVLIALFYGAGYIKDIVTRTTLDRACPGRRVSLR